MTPIQTYESPDGRMLHRVDREGRYVRLEDYEKLEKRLHRYMAATMTYDALRDDTPESKESDDDLIDRPGN